ncbi:MAG: hypothetical protein Nk1A_8300 [Endomicrobiia bacterium]|nr:MAG: hypothetical protein Nk1A_8300 [Endomicrobiia bacterium]
MVKAIAVLKQHVSGLVLGFNMLSGAKETVNGMFHHYTRAVANSIA